MEIQKGLEWVTDILSVQGRVLTPEDTRHTVAEWDSLGDLMLLSGLDEKFGIVVSADDLSAINSIAEILELMEKNNALSAG